MSANAVGKKGIIASQVGMASADRQAGRRARSLGLRGTISVSVILLVLAIAVVGPWIAPHDPTDQSIRSRLLPPAWVEGGSREYWLGTDQLGRDLLSRLLEGARISLLISVSAATFAMVVGVTVGLAAGFFRGWVDEVLMRIVDIQLSVPYLLLAITLMALLEASMRNVMIVLAVSGWIIYARMVRGMALSMSEREFVTAARAIGCSHMRIMFRHVAPNLVPVIIVLFTLQIAQFVIAESALSFLGVGIKPPTPSWGSIMNEGREYLALAWWIETFPGIAILLTTLAIGLLGEWLRDVLDPRMRV